MNTDIIGKFLGIALAFVLLVVAPFIEYTAQQTSLDSRAIVSVVNNFIDEVVDSREITDSMLRQFNADLAQYSIAVDYEIIRERRVIDPDPLNPGEYYPSMVVTDDNRHYEQGDHITVHIYEVGTSASASIAYRLARVTQPRLDYTFSARVR